MPVVLVLSVGYCTSTCILEIFTKTQKLSSHVSVHTPDLITTDNSMHICTPPQSQDTTSLQAPNELGTTAHVLD